jgi:serine protease Do
VDFARVAADLRQVTVELLHGDRILGSGIALAPDWVVTNAHVAPSVHAVLRRSDGRNARGQVVAKDPEADLALLSVPGLDAAEAVAYQGELRIGSLVVAMGHPLGVRGAVTAGVVHAVGPVMPGGRTWIQADLTLAPGNSGGPLADARGRIVGVNSMVAGGLALAIPVADVMRFARGAMMNPR